MKLQHNSIKNLYFDDAVDINLINLDLLSKLKYLSSMLDLLQISVRLHDIYFDCTRKIIITASILSDNLNRVKKIYNDFVSGITSFDTYTLDLSFLTGLMSYLNFCIDSIKDEKVTYISV